MAFYPQQPLIQRLQHVEPVQCDWHGCQQDSERTLFGDVTPLAGRLSRYCARHARVALTHFSEQTRL